MWVDNVNRIREILTNVKEHPLQALIRFVTNIIGLVWIWPTLPFYKFAHNYVFNYHLQRGIPLKRLNERSPTWHNSGWILSPRNTPLVNGFGFVRYRKVETFWYWVIVIFIWGWQDADANQLFTDVGYINSIKVGVPSYLCTNPKDDRSKSWKFFWIRPFLKSYNEYDVPFGNMFDLCDKRPWYFSFWATLAWNLRNTAQNFTYLWEKTS